MFSQKPVVYFLLMGQTSEIKKKKQLDVQIEQKRVTR